MEGSAILPSSVLVSHEIKDISSRLRDREKSVSCIGRLKTGKLSGKKFQETVKLKGKQRKAS